MSSFCYLHFYSKNIRVYTIFNDKSFKDKLTNNIVSFEQQGPGYYFTYMQNDLHLHILLMSEDTFLHGETQMKASEYL